MNTISVCYWNVMRIFLLFLFFNVLAVVCPHKVLGENTYSYHGQLYEKGMELFHKKQYNAAQYYLNRYVDQNSTSVQTIDATFYIACCAAILKHSDAEARFRKFIASHPHDPKVPLAYFELANMYFYDEAYTESITHYRLIDIGMLDDETNYTRLYRMGYAYLCNKDFDNALQCFNQIKNFSHKYTYASSYYAGFIGLQNSAFEASKLDLERAAEHESFESVVPYLMVQWYYKKGEYKKLLSYIKKVKESHIALKNQDEIELLIAETYFIQKNFHKAARHYENYLILKGKEPDVSVLYRLAYVAYKTNAKEKAIGYFEKAALDDGDIGQLASYHLGLLYLGRKEKKRALNAFEKARSSSYHEDIQEEAYWQHAKLYYELDHLSKAIEAIEDFVRIYPNSRHLREARGLLSKAYLHTSHYDLAIQHLEGIPKKSPPMRKTYQKVTFLQAGELFNDDAYEEAIASLKKSLKHPIDKQLVAQGNLHLAECLSAIQKFEESIGYYKRFLQSPANNKQRKKGHRQAQYGLAYAYFQLQQYDKAKPIFARYIAANDYKHPFYADSLVRLADCYYSLRNYQASLKKYEKALTYKKAIPHILYQKGVISSILGQYAEAHAYFSTLLKSHQDTTYYEQALFQEAKTFLEQGNYTEAIRFFSKFIDQRPQSLLLPTALLNRAIAAVNIKKNKQAISDCEKLLSKYPHHPSARDALFELQKISSPQHFDAYLKQYQAACPEDTSIEGISFDAAKAHFFEQRYPEAIQTLQDFLARYPKSDSCQEAYYLMAEALGHQGQHEEALNHYYEALNHGKTRVYNRVLTRIARAEYQLENFDRAKKYFDKLYHSANNKKEHYYALQGLMKTHFVSHDYPKVDEMAKKIIEEGNITVNAVSEALLYLGKTAFEQKKYEHAIENLKKTKEHSHNVYAAEAQYWLAYIAFQEKKYQESIELLFTLNKVFPTYERWIDKSFLLIAENYMANDELFQAKATLNSIIEGDSNEETKKQALAMLARCESLASSKAALITTIKPEQQDAASLEKEKVSSKRMKEIAQEEKEFKVLEDEKKVKDEVKEDKKDSATEVNNTTDKKEDTNHATSNEA